MSGQPKWTRDQQRALDARGHTVLGSAAAGSGKTAVLTERAVRRMLDPADPISADRLLVVTFTRDAAREMKQRMVKKLAERIYPNAAVKYGFKQYHCRTECQQKYLSEHK